MYYYMDIQFQISCFDGKTNSPSIGRPLQNILHCVGLHNQLLAFQLQQ